MEDKYCRFCGALLPEEALFCTKCGKATAAESGDEESYTEADKERGQGERDAADESARNADDHESHWLKRSEDRLDRETEAARERKEDQQKQKWNRKRIIVVAVVALIVIAAIISAVLGSRPTTQSNKSQDSTSGSDAASKCVAVSKSGDSIYDRSCDSDSEDNPSATLKYLYKQLSSKTVGDESVQLSGRDTSTDRVPYFFISSSVEKLQYENGVLWYFGKAIGENPFSYLPRMVSDAAGAVGYNESVLGFDGSPYDANEFVEKTDDFEKQVPYYRYSVSGYGDVVVGLVTYSLDGGKQFKVFIFVYDAEDVPDWVTDIHDSSRTTQSNSSTSNNDQAPGNNGSTSVDTDFTDLWTAVAIKENLSKIAGEYCRNDGACVKINANIGHTAGDYSTKPGEISFTSGDQASNPLPDQSAELGLSFAFQQQPTTVPDTVTPIDMQTMTDGCNAASDSSCQAGVTYVMPGAGASRFSDRVESGNPPDGNKSYLVIGWQTKVSNDTVFYRK
ncbi:zinc ribbon domain-containing protein [Bifidobacterium margollesii]|uniref:zinc ribbon domain-containing protein n=1 Tax=Bifidobacterium margollesii TaxID=2020964 RepID=UPI00105577C6|nr:zinc ribbon domain-containing protein [Bifidobacterium margollesii]